MEVDTAMQKLGDCGKWQFSIILLIIFSIKVPSLWNVNDVVVIGYKPPHHCKIHANSSVQNWIPEDENGKLSSCSMYVNSSNEMTGCMNGWTYDTQESGPTIATKWDLVCDRSYIVGLTQTFFFLGAALGSTSCSRLADKYGRKWVLCLVMTLESFIGILIVLSNQFKIFLFFRFWLGFFTGAGLTSKLVYLVETFSSKLRHSFLMFDYACGGIVVSLMFVVAFLLASWTRLQLFISIYPLFYLPILMWWLPETIPWLYANNKIEEAEKVVLFAGKMNKVTFTQPIFKRLEDDSDVDQLDEQNDEEEGIMNVVTKSKYQTFEEKYHKKIGWIRKLSKIFEKKGRKKKVLLKTHCSVFDLVRNKYLLRHMTWSIVFLINMFLYYTSIYTTGSLSTNRFIDGFINSIMEVPACFFIAIALKKYGLKKPVILCLVTSSIPMFACIWSDSYESQSMMYSYFTLTFLTIAKFFSSASVHVIFFYANELFPVNIRQQAVGIGFTISRIGSILAGFSPLFMEMNSKVLYACLGVASLLAAMLSLVLPETSNRALPETIEDIEAWYKEDKSDDGWLSFFWKKKKKFDNENDVSLSASGAVTNASDAVSSASDAVLR